MNSPGLLAEAGAILTRIIEQAIKEAISAHKEQAPISGCRGSGQDFIGLTIEDLLKGLKGDPDAGKALVTEIVAQFTKEYLTIEEVSKRLSWEERTVKNKMETGIFQKGVHYFAPKGIRPRFKWQAIVAWLEETQTIATEKTAPATDAIPMARGYLLGQRRKKIAATS